MHYSRLRSALRRGSPPRLPCSGWTTDGPRTRGVGWCARRLHGTPRWWRFMPRSTGCSQRLLSSSRRVLSMRMRPCATLSGSDVALSRLRARGWCAPSRVVARASGPHVRACGFSGGAGAPPTNQQVGLSALAALGRHGAVGSRRQRVGSPRSGHQGYARPGPRPLALAPLDADARMATLASPSRRYVALTLGSTTSGPPLAVTSAMVASGTVPQQSKALNRSLASCHSRVSTMAGKRDRALTPPLTVVLRTYDGWKERWS